MDMVYAVIGLSLLECLIFQMCVGRARIKYSVDAPKVIGNEVFERYYRVHYNTIEMLVLFIPSAMLFGYYISELWASILGLLFVLGRAAYFFAYVKNPAKRGAGFGLSFLPVLIMLLGGFAGAVLAALGG